jgi:hypothetical protein
MADLMRTPRSYRENARRLRATFVHVAGCTYDTCACRDVLPDLIDVYQGPPVGVPRSLRRQFGRTIERPIFRWDFSDCLSRKARNRAFSHSAIRLL